MVISGSNPKYLALTLTLSILSLTRTQASKLAVGSEYRFRVSAENIVGQGAWSEALLLSTTNEAAALLELLAAPYNTPNPHKLDEYN